MASPKSVQRCPISIRNCFGTITDWQWLGSVQKSGSRSCESNIFYQNMPHAAAKRQIAPRRCVYVDKLTQFDFQKFSSWQQPQHHFTASPSFWLQRLAMTSKILSFHKVQFFLYGSNGFSSSWQAGCPTSTLWKPQFRNCIWWLLRIWPQYSLSK